MTFSQLRLETLFTPKEVAEGLHVPIGRIHQWFRDGWLRGYKFGGSIRIPESAIDEFIERYKRKSTVANQSQK